MNQDTLVCYVSDDGVNVVITTKNVNREKVEKLHKDHELQPLYKVSSSRYKDMITKFSTQFSVDRNTTRKWFYIGIGNSNSWFRNVHCRFISPEHVERIENECGFKPKSKKKVSLFLKEYRKNILKELKTLNLEANRIGGFVNYLGFECSPGFTDDDIVFLFEYFSFVQVELPLDYLSGFDFPNPNWK